MVFDPVKFKRTYRDLQPLTGTGPDGYRNEFLRALASGMSCNISREAVNLHMLFAQDFVNAELPAWYYWVACAITEVTIVKAPAAQPGGTPDVRPIGMGGCKRRAWTSRLFEDNSDMLRRTCWPVQVALGV